MDAEIAIKTILALAGIVGAGRRIYEMVLGSKSRLREEYKFAKEFLRDLEGDNDLHPYVIEKGYHAIAGTASITSDEVAYLLSLENPGRCLKDYVLSRKYLEHLGDKGGLQISFAGKYKSRWSRRWRKALYLTVYFGGSFAALSPLLFVEPLGFGIKELSTSMLFSLPVFGFFAFESMRTFVKISRSEFLVKNQKKHTGCIFSPCYGNGVLQGGVGSNNG